MKPGPKKGEGGRPKIDINWEQVQQLARIDCTIREISAVIGVTDQCLNIRCKEENDCTVGNFIAENREHGKASIRRVLAEKALKDKDGPTLRFLAENRLGYGRNINTTQDVKVSGLSSEARAVLDSMPKDELMIMRNMKEALEAAEPDPEEEDTEV